jgi:hypothetical protein
MLHRIITILIIGLLFLSGCAVNSSYQVGGYQNNLYSDIKFLGQYEIQYVITTRDDKRMVLVKPFISDGKNLPDKITKLHLGLMVINPNREKFEVWIESKFTELDTGNLFQLNKYVYKTQVLPKEFISIPLPRNVKPNTQVEFWVQAVSEGGVVLYKSSMVNYKIGK